MASSHMFAKYQLNVHNTPTGDGEALVEVGGTRQIVVRASASPDQEDTLVLEALAQFLPKQPVLRVFRDLANDRLPADADPYETLSVRVEPGQSLNGHIPSPHILPKSFRGFSEMLLDEMRSAVRRVLTLHRWRSDIYPPERRGLSTGGSYFSFDGDKWFRLPEAGSVRMSSRAWIRLDEGRFNSAVDPLLAADLDEPLGFDLLSEAAELSLANDRGALTVAIAALEVGVKSFIGQVVPDAEWLAMQAPTPPVVQILREYLPQLPVRQPLPSGEVRPPPARTLDAIKDAIDRRNLVIHRGGQASNELVDNTIIAVSDVLRLLDYYGGIAWAAEHMSYEFAVDLALRERDEDLEAFLREP